MTRRRVVDWFLVTIGMATAMMVAPVVAQKTPDGGSGDSLVDVETLELEPTVVKTGDVITQIYRVRFPDLISEGKEILILEDRMTPEGLPVHPFEAVALDVRKRQIDDEHVWDFEYSLRLVSPEKERHIVPSFSFYYLTRDLGEEVEDAEVEQVDATGNLVRYVTTIPEVPVLDIRDRIELGTFGSRATAFRALAWGVAPLPLLVWAVLLVRHARRPDTISEDRKREVDELERIEAQIPVPPSIWQARRTLFDRIRVLDDLAPGAKGESLHVAQRNLVIAGREYLRAEIPELHTGDTPKDMRDHITGLTDGVRKDALLILATRFVTYQSGLERDASDPLDDPAGEASVLTTSVAQLRPHVRLWTRVKRVFGGGLRTRCW